MHYKKILKHLYSLESPQIKLGLDRIQNLLNKISNPEKPLKCIHVAGTNGKGSVCSMIHYAFIEAGYKVGLYTSPHLKKFNERIRVNGMQITDKEVVEYFLKLKPHVTDQSFFEITTAMAFLYFREKNVDFAVLEVGLGGRLDATNVVNPLVSVITNIGLEHTGLLGKTIEKIACEKAGIIKQNVPVVTGSEGKALEVIEEIAKKRDAPLFLPKQCKRINFKYLHGEYQQQNKDLALTTIYILKKFYFSKIKFFQIRKGIRRTVWPGRMQFIGQNVLVDCAHNPSGFKALRNELINIKKRKKIKNLVFVIGLQQDKDIKEIFKIIRPLASATIFTKSKNKKSANPEDLLETLKKIDNNQNIKTKILKNARDALDYAKKIAGKNDLVVVAGSIYMVGDLLQI